MGFLRDRVDPKYKNEIWNKKWRESEQKSKEE